MFNPYLTISFFSFFNATFIMALKAMIFVFFHSLCIISLFFLHSFMVQNKKSAVGFSV